MKDESKSTISLTKYSSSERSIINVVSRPQKTLHSSNAFFAQSSTCLLILQPLLLIFSTSFSLRPKKWLSKHLE
jgi:hypothetical protein